MKVPVDFIKTLEKHSHEYHQVVSIDRKRDKVASVDLSKTNPSFTPDVYSNSEKLSAFIGKQREKANATFLIGGYKEHREMYRRSELFDKDKNISAENVLLEEPRSLHLGIDIWGEAGTKIYAPLGGMIHSFAFNNHFGDYGATIILQHQLDTVNFYTLYGHLSLKDLNCRKGQFITRGENFAHFGIWEENGNWPPHLHFQLIFDLSNYEGDYPGVCKISESAKYVNNCPDPNIILNIQH